MATHITKLSFPTISYYISLTVKKLCYTITTRIIQYHLHRFFKITQFENHPHRDVENIILLTIELYL